jgi:seryl-tRNA synthetase
MPVDLNLLRADKGGDPEMVKASEKKRCRDGAQVDKVLAIDEEWRKARYELDQKNRAINAISKAIGEKKKASKGKDKCEEEIKESNAMKEEYGAMKAKEAELEASLKAELNKIGNLVHETVIPDDNEDNNAVVQTWGEIEESKIDGSPGHMHHHQLMRCLDMYEPDRGAKVAGHRGYFLKGFGVLLNQAVI